MNFRTYQKTSKETAVYPHVTDQPIIGIMYATLGLAGEAGEVADNIKKSWRNDMRVTEERRDKVKDEIGDVLWYAAQLCTELGISLEDAAKQNIEKLQSRQRSDELKHHA